MLSFYWNGSPSWKIHRLHLFFCDIAWPSAKCPTTPESSQRTCNRRPYRILIATCAQHSQLQWVCAQTMPRGSGLVAKLLSAALGYGAWAAQKAAPEDLAEVSALPAAGG